MVRISEDLIRRRAEHNEGHLTNLEEVSLHQQDIERIEYIDKWCRDLKILYLQSNLIGKIENVARLKKLEYINLALNNIERVENLESCESLRKLDLTVNFVGELTSIECLSQLEHFHELFLTGNPCTEYEFYEEYVISTLQHLKYLDGHEINRSDRIRAEQVRDIAVCRTVEQQTEYMRKREEEKRLERKRLSKDEVTKNHGFDGRWYTHINESDKDERTGVLSAGVQSESESDPFGTQDKKFWEEKVPFTPESRLEVHEQIKRQRQRTEHGNKDESIKRDKRMVTENGRILNMNEGKLDFTLEDDEQNNRFVFHLETYKYMDSSLIDINVHPTYLRAIVKGKVFQLVLPEAVNADAASAERSQVTGHITIMIPKANELIKSPNVSKMAEEPRKSKTNRVEEGEQRHEPLEIDVAEQMNLKIVKASKSSPPLGYVRRERVHRTNSEDFVDDPDVPPLE